MLAHGRTKNAPGWPKGWPAAWWHIACNDHVRLVACSWLKASRCKQMAHNRVPRKVALASQLTNILHCVASHGAQLTSATEVRVLATASEAAPSDGGDAGASADIVAHIRGQLDTVCTLDPGNQSLALSLTYSLTRPTRLLAHLLALLIHPLARSFTLLAHSLTHHSPHLTSPSRSPTDC